MKEKKLFGEFLIDKGIVTQEVLVDALLEQLRNMPSLPEFAFKTTGIQPDLILGAFRLQVCESLSFPDALQRSTQYSPDQMKALLDSHAATRTPIGELLIKRGIPLEQLIHAFDEFLNEHAEKPTTPVPAPAAAEAAAPARPLSHAEQMVASHFAGDLDPRFQNEIRTEAEAEAKVAVESAPAPVAEAPAPAGDSSVKDPSMVQEYLDLCGGTDKRDILLGRLAFLKACQDQITPEAQEQLTESVKTTHLLLGGARFLKLPKSESLLGEIEKALMKIIKSKSGFRPGLCEELHDSIGGAIRQVWDYREALAKTGTEGGIETAAIQGIIQKLLGEIQPMEKEQSA
jgi:hypothetical protein